MNIVVCIKQVPDVDDIKWTKENNLDRANMLSKLNTLDEYALDYAVEIKQKYKNVTITAYSMGPTQAADSLEYALAKGASRAVLLSDKLFSGSDTYATAKILSAAIKKYSPDFNLILTGQAAADGDTEQTHISIAQMLDIIDATSVVDIPNADKHRVIAVQNLNNEVNTFELKTPCIIAVKQPCKTKYVPNIEDYIRAQNTKIEVYNADDLKFEKKDVGIMGSPTMVAKTYRPVTEKNTIEITDNKTEAILKFMLGE